MPSDLAEPILKVSRPSKRNLICSIPDDYIPLRRTANSSTGESVILSFFALFPNFALHVWNLIRRDFISLNSLNVDRNTPDEILACWQSLGSSARPARPFQLSFPAPVPGKKLLGIAGHRRRPYTVRQFLQLSYIFY